MYNDPGSVAEVSDKSRFFRFLVEWPEGGLRKLQAGWCTVLRGSLEPYKKLEPSDAGAVGVRRGVGEMLPEIEELLKEFFVKMP